MSKELLFEINAAAQRLGIAPTTLCQRAVANSALPSRLSSGGSVTLRTAERIREWIRIALGASQTERAA